MNTTFAYKLLDLGGLDHRAIEATLNRLGSGGWELITVLPPQTAILKCATEEAARTVAREAPQPVAAKYRDPETGETWSGRGRRANWLAERIKAGGKLDDFLA